MLSDFNVFTANDWTKNLPKISFDKRVKAITDMGEKKKMVGEYLQKVKEKIHG